MANRSRALVLAVGYLMAATPGHAAGQDVNILLPVDSIERLLRLVPFELEHRSGSRFEGDRTQRVVLLFPDSSVVMAKWARAPSGGQVFNNVPRYEIAAYELQKLFLDEPDYVVPPTVARAVPLEWYRAQDASVSPTFTGTSSVLVVLQYWLFAVTGRDVYDAARLQSDTAYARHFGNLNVLTYLIRHNDSNHGNIMIAEELLPPRLFSVDNGVAFRSEVSDRGYEWRNLRTRSISRRTVDRLREISREELQRKLRVVAQFDIRDGVLLPAERDPQPLASPGVRRTRELLQLGLTDAEINGVHQRLQSLLRQVDSGRLEVF